jgi:hypothetical protein
MKILENFDWSVKSIAKVIGIVILGIIALTVVISLISFSVKTIFGTASYRSYDGYDYATEQAVSYDMGGAPAMMAKITMPPIPEPGYTTGDDAEEFEVKEYYGTIKTRHLDNTCAIIADLKVREDIIFESSDKNKESCHYRFKVKKEISDEIVKIIEDLKPDNFNASIQTIKGTIEKYDDELIILNKKLASIEETLEMAQDSYDEISKLATRQQDAETLAKIIDSKLQLIEKLSNERLSVKERIDRFNESKADQLDRLNYTFFNIDIYKDLIFDWKDIKDSWKYETKQLVINVNEVFQGISLHLAAYLVRFVQVVIYLFISLFLLKFVWIGVKRVWKGKKK